LTRGPVRHIDVFNGDADGICALHQLRLHEPCEAETVTGLKHDVALLERVNAGAGDRVTVLDISLERNREALARLLEAGAHVRYFDHHLGEAPRHPRLQCFLDPTGLACTAELVDRHLEGRFRAWAVVAAFGDNFAAAAARLAASLGFDDPALARLRSLGESLNYAGYGAGPEDLLVHPLELYRLVSRYRDPFVLASSEPLFAWLASAREADLERARAEGVRQLSAGARAAILPDASWSRRVMGAWANRLADEMPRLAQAVLAPLPAGGYAVSLRAPMGSATTAAAFCRGFPGGGGRTTAAGIGRLGAAGLEAFLAALAATYREAA
jgi:hypothetical protein